MFLNQSIGHFVDIGPDHEKRSEPCQDAAVAESSGDWRLIAVSDGAGSARLSHLGSELLLKKISSALQAAEYDEEMDPLKVRSLVSNAVLDFRQDCAENSLEQNIKDFACTVVGAIISPGLEYVSFHIGDGAMVLIGEDDCVVKSLPENGEYANETYFATSENWIEHIRFQDGKMATGQMLIAMTDGVTPFAISGATPFKEFLKPLAKFIAENKPEMVSDALKQTLSTGKAAGISRDDKAMAWFGC